MLQVIFVILVIWAVERHFARKRRIQERLEDRDDHPSGVPRWEREEQFYE